MGTAGGGPARVSPRLLPRPPRPPLMPQAAPTGGATTCSDKVARASSCRRVAASQQTSGGERLPTHGRHVYSQAPQAGPSGGPMEWDGAALMEWGLREGESELDSRCSVTPSERGSLRGCTLVATAVSERVRGALPLRTHPRYHHNGHRHPGGLTAPAPCVPQGTRHCSPDGYRVDEAAAGGERYLDQKRSSRQVGKLGSFASILTGRARVIRDSAELPVQEKRSPG